MHPFALVLAAVVALAPATGPQPRAARIVSLVPSLTEDLFAIGAGGQVVGTSAFTDYPAIAARLPQVASSGSIDAERIVQLHPDLVVGITAQGPQARVLRSLGMHVVLLDDDSYDDIYADLTALGRLSGRSAQAATLAGRLRARAAAIERGVPPGRRPRAFVVLGAAPIFTVGDGSYIARLLAMAGGKNAAGGLRTAYGRYSAEVLVAAQPDVLIGDPGSGLAGVLDRAPWNALRAVREHRVYILKNADILERPGPRFTEGLAWLAARFRTSGA